MNEVADTPTTSSGAGGAAHWRRLAEGASGSGELSLAETITLQLAVGVALDLHVLAPLDA